MGIKRTDFKMETGLDTVGEHFVQASFFNEKFGKEFSFLVKVIVRPKKTGSKKNETDDLASLAAAETDKQKAKLLSAK